MGIYILNDPKICIVCNNIDLKYSCDELSVILIVISKEKICIDC